MTDVKDARDVQKAPKWKKFFAEKLGWKVYLKHEQKDGWTGKLPFYMFECPECECLVCDYPHGHPERQYLLCPKCGVKIDFVRFWTDVKIFFSSIFVLFSLCFRRK